jgi:hypothetical protein
MTKDELLKYKLLKYLEEDKDIQKAIKKIVKKKEEKIDNDTQGKDTTSAVYWRPSKRS